MSVQVDARQSQSVIDSQEQADGVVMRLHNAVDKLRLCLGSPASLSQQPLPRNTALPPEVSDAVEGLTEEILGLFMQVQSFEGRLQAICSIIIRLSIRSKANSNAGCKGVKAKMIVPYSLNHMKSTNLETMLHSHARLSCVMPFPDRHNDVQCASSAHSLNATGINIQQGYKSFQEHAADSGNQKNVTALARALSLSPEQHRKMVFIRWRS